MWLITIAGFWLFGEFLIRVITWAAKRAGLLTGRIRLIKEWIWLLIAVLAIGGIVHIVGLASQFTTLTISGIIAVAFSLHFEQLSRTLFQASCYYSKYPRSMI